MGYIFFILSLLFFVELNSANGLTSLAKFDIAPFITVNDWHIRSFGVGYDHKRKLVLYGLHHDYLSLYEVQGLVRYHNVTQGPRGSFGANVIVSGIDYGFKTLFPSQWKYERIVMLLIKLCVRRYGNMTFEQYCKTMNREAFEDTIKGLLVRVIFDKKKYHIVSAYPIIKRLNNQEL